MAASISIIWHGISCFTIEAKNGDATAVLVTDPYDLDVGLKLPRNLSADVVTVSHEDPAHDNVEAVKAEGEKKLFVISSPGEYEISGLFVYGIRSASGNTLYRYEIGDLSVGFLGGLGSPLSDAEQEALEDVDILLVPVGNEGALTAKQAVEAVTALSPRVVVPMQYAIPGLMIKCDPVDKFLKEMGASKAEHMAKVKLMKKDLPAEETKVIVIDRE
jgi:L-ascorbate metabolism protein UlaG (beta-lactamase superfamily)